MSNALLREFHHFMAESFPTRAITKTLALSFATSIDISIISHFNPCVYSFQYSLQPHLGGQQYDLTCLLVRTCAQGSDGGSLHAYEGGTPDSALILVSGFHPSLVTPIHFLGTFLNPGCRPSRIDNANSKPLYIPCMYES